MKEDTTKKTNNIIEQNNKNEDAPLPPIRIKSSFIRIQFLGGIQMEKTIAVEITLIGKTFLWGKEETRSYRTPTTIL